MQSYHFIRKIIGEYWDYWDTWLSQFVYLAFHLFESKHIRLFVDKYYFVICIINLLKLEFPVFGWFLCFLLVLVPVLAPFYRLDIPPLCWLQGRNVKMFLENEQKIVQTERWMESSTKYAPALKWSHAPYSSTYLRETYWEISWYVLFWEDFCVEISNLIRHSLAL